MKKLLVQVWKDQDGVLTFEWILLVTLLTIGIVGGLSGVRDAILDELTDVALAMVSLDQSYTIVNPVDVQIHDGIIDGASDSHFLDGRTFSQCRPPSPGAVDMGTRTQGDEP